MWVNDNQGLSYSLGGGFKLVVWQGRYDWRLDLRVGQRVITHSCSEDPQTLTKRLADQITQGVWEGLDFMAKDLIYSRSELENMIRFTAMPSLMWESGRDRE